MSTIYLNTLRNTALSFCLSPISNPHHTYIDTKYAFKYIKFKRHRKIEVMLHYVKPGLKFNVQRFTMAFKSQPIS